jgi:L-histidine N-alpha-methyltransferase
VAVLALCSHLTAEDLAAALRADVAAGLTATPKDLPPKWFYDPRGCQLFEQITQLPEYYPTRRERVILDRDAPAIAAAAGADTLVELGSGSSTKTRLLLDALSPSLRRYVPVDVSPTALLDAAAKLAADYPSLEIEPVVADFEGSLHFLPSTGRRLVAFLGGTIGNLLPAQRATFYRSLAGQLRPDEHLLLGTDLVKPLDRLLPAYDDEAGVTAEFNKNVLHVINRELAADFDPSRFAHVAAWDPVDEHIEMRLRSLREQTVHVRALDLTVQFAEGEEMRTEVSAKFRRAKVTAELAAAGLELTHWWTDPAGDFALSLSRPR